MVAGDIRAEEIRLVWGTVVRCEDCYSLTEQGECRLVTHMSLDNKLIGLDNIQTEND